MEPHISQHWILGQVTITYHWINLQYQDSFNSPFGKFEYVKVPFGLAQAPAYFLIQVLDPYLPRHMPYNVCNHQLHQNKLEPFLAWSDIIESSSRDSQK